MKIESVYDEGFRAYGRVWGTVPRALTDPVLDALERKTPCPEEGPAYVASEPALEELEVADPFKLLLFGGRAAQLGWCNGHNTRLDCLEYHRSSEFNLGTQDFVLLLARLDQVEGEGEQATLDTGLVRAFRVPAGVTVELFGTALHYAPCQTSDKGFRVLVALPKGTNADRPDLDASLRAAGDASLLWAADKWLLAHEESAEAAAGAHVGLVGQNIDIAQDL